MLVKRIAIIPLANQNKSNSKNSTIRYVSKKFKRFTSSSCLELLCPLPLKLNSLNTLYYTHMQLTLSGNSSQQNVK